MRKRKGARRKYFDGFSSSIIYTEKISKSSHFSFFSKWFYNFKMKMTGSKTSLNIFVFFFFLSSYANKNKNKKLTCSTQTTSGIKGPILKEYNNVEAWGWFIIESFSKFTRKQKEVKCFRKKKKTICCSLLTQ